MIKMCIVTIVAQIGKRTLNVFASPLLQRFLDPLKKYKYRLFSTPHLVILAVI
jgi:hypothetical protein